MGPYLHYNGLLVSLRQPKAFCSSPASGTLRNACLWCGWKSCTFFLSHFLPGDLLPHSFGGHICGEDNSEDRQDGDQRGMFRCVTFFFLVVLWSNPLYPISKKEIWGNYTMLKRIFESVVSCLFFQAVIISWKLSVFLLCPMAIMFLRHLKCGAKLRNQLQKLQHHLFRCYVNWML